MYTSDEVANTLVGKQRAASSLETNLTRTRVNTGNYSNGPTAWLSRPFGRHRAPAPSRRAAAGALSRWSLHTWRQLRAPGRPWRRPSMWRAMALHGVPCCGGLARHVVAHLRFDLLAGQVAGQPPPKNARPTRQPPGVVIGLAADHHAVQLVQLLGHLRAGGDAAVDGNGEVRKLVSSAGAPARSAAAALRGFPSGQAFEPGVAGVDDEHVAAGLADGADKVAHKLVALGPCRCRCGA